MSPVFLFEYSLFTCYSSSSNCSSFATFVVDAFVSISATIGARQLLDYIHSSEISHYLHQLRLLLA